MLAVVVVAPHIGAAAAAAATAMEHQRKATKHKHTWTARLTTVPWVVSVVYIVVVHSPSYPLFLVNFLT